MVLISGNLSSDENTHDCPEPIIGIRFPVWN